MGRQSLKIRPVSRAWRSAPAQQTGAFAYQISRPPVSGGARRQRALELTRVTHPGDRTGPISCSYSLPAAGLSDPLLRFSTVPELPARNALRGWMLHASELRLLHPSALSHLHPAGEPVLTPAAEPGLPHTSDRRAPLKSAYVSSSCSSDSGLCNTTLLVVAGAIFSATTAGIIVYSPSGLVIHRQAGNPPTAVNQLTCGGLSTMIF